jgi:TonB family protein
VPAGCGSSLRVHSQPPPQVGCRTTIVKGVNAADYYPRKAKKERRSGVVIVGVTVNEGEPQPAKVVVAESSSHEDLDKAALRPFATPRSPRAATNPPPSN